MPFRIFLLTGCFLLTLAGMQPASCIEKINLSDRGYDISHYDLDLRFENLSSGFSGKVKIFLRLTRPLVDNYILDASRQLRIDSVLLDEVPATFTRKGDSLKVCSGNLPGKWHTLTVFYRREASLEESFFEPLTSRYDSNWEIRVLSTQSEPEGSHQWFPCKQDLKDKADSVSVSLTVPQRLYAVSNGLLESIEDLEDGFVRYAWKSRYPIAYYLISLAISDYLPLEEYVRLENAGSDSDSVLLVHYLYNRPRYLKENSDKASEVGKAMQWFSQQFGNYPFLREKYGQVIAPIGGGIENQTITTLSDLNFSLMAHELAHSWFGNLVTCASWNDIWINEGLATYAEYLAIHAILGDEEARRWMRTAQNWAVRNRVRSVYIPEEELQDPWRIFDYGSTYQKGACLLHQLRYEINNDSLFFETLRRFLLNFAYRTASVPDFIETLKQVTGKDFQWYFDQWYYKPGSPEFNLQWEVKGSELVVNLSQESDASENPVFKTHFDLLLRDHERNEKKVRLFLSGREQTFVIPIQQPVTQVLFDPEGWLIKR